MKILLIVYDNDAYVSYFPLNIAYIAAVCRDAGNEVEIYHQDVYHWPESHLLEYLNNHRFDLVGIGSCGGYYQYHKVLKIAAAINQSIKRPFFVIGGHLVSPEPEYFLNKTQADAIVIGEGERTIIDLIDTLESKRNLSEVNGIAYLENGKFIKTQPRDLIQDIDSIPFPAWDLFPMDHYAMLRLPNIKHTQRCIPALSGRGCTFTCNFCYRMDKGFRPRSAESIIEEIDRLKKDYAISYITFADELMMSSVERTFSLCESFIKAKLDVQWTCNGRLNYAKPEVLKIMKEAGCVFINYGIESLDEQALKNMNKALTEKIIVTGVENTLNSGISPGLNIIFGNIGETVASLEKGVNFLLKYDDHSQLRTIRPVTPYPGSPLYYDAIDRGLLNDCEDFYENKHMNSDLLTINFTELSDDGFHQVLFKANKTLIEHYYEYQRTKSLENTQKLYCEKDATFRGFRQS